MTPQGLVTLLVTALLALIGFCAVTAWLTKVSKELWNKNDTRLPLSASWIAYAFVLSIAYGRFVWDGLKLEDLLTMWAVLIALMLLVSLLMFVRGQRR